MAILLGFIFLGLGFGVVLAVASRYRDIALALIVGFALRAFLALIDVLAYPLPGQSDSIVFDYFGYYQARNGIAGTFEYFRSGARLYTWFVSFFYALFDRSPLMMQAINVLLGTLIIFNVSRLAATLGKDERYGRYAAWTAALFPSFIYFSAALLREMVVTYPLTLGVLGLAQWFEKGHVRSIVLAAVAISVSMSFHSGSIAVLAVAGLWMVANSVKSLLTGQVTNLARTVIALALGAALAGMVLSSGFGLDKFANVSSGEMDDLTTTQRAFARGRAAYLEDLHPETASDLVWQTPIRLVYFLFAPFPWMVSSLADVIGLVDSLFFLALFVHVFRQRQHLRKSRSAVLVFMAFSALALTFAIGVSNYGTALRHRNKMLPLLLGVAMSLPRRRNTKESTVIAHRSPSISIQPRGHPD